MASTLRIQLLGDFRLMYDDSPITSVNTARLQALLAYLVLHRGAPQLRQHIAFLFWPDSLEAQARTNLRKLFYLLRNALPDADRFLDADAQTLQWRPDAPFTLDVADFERALAQADSIDSLQDALALYHGDLLPSCYDDWIAPLRERLRQSCVAALERLTAWLDRRHDCRAAIGCAQRLLRHDPLNESTYRCLIRLYTVNGDRAEAIRAYRACVEALRRELGAEPDPATREVYERALRASTTDSRLPAQPTPFVGREKELAALARQLADPRCRLLTLVGLGGIGKSRLAVQAALEHSEPFADGAHFVPLAPISAASFIVPAIAQSLKFSFAGSGDPKIQLLNFLREKHALLVLDNFEHLLLPAPSGRGEGGEGESLLADILQHAPRVKLIVTSRERLNVSEERVIKVEGLEFPTSPQSPLLRGEGYSALQLFAQTARRAHWAFAPSPTEEQSIARVCQLVEGVPLAVELAASWVRVISCAEIAQEIERGLDILSTALSGLPDRHRSMRAVFDYSWKLLSGEERKVFSRLSVFRGGFRREAAERVAGASLRTLAALVDASFLRHTEAGRYEMHELVRQYGGEKLHARKASEGLARNKHCVYYADFVQQRADALKGGRQKQALDEISSEIENVRASWRWACERRKANAIGKFAQGLGLFYEMHSRFQEGAEAFASAVNALGVAGARRGESAMIPGQALAWQGAFAGRLGHYQTAKELLRKSLSIARRLGVQADIAFCLRHLGAVTMGHGAYAEAKQFFQESLALCQQIGDRFGAARSFNHLGNVAEAVGDYAEARQLFFESLAIQRASGDPWGIAIALNNLGSVAEALGNYAEARQLFDESITIKQEMGDERGVGYSLNNAGYAAYRLREYGHAERSYQESFALFKKIGDPRGVSLCLSNLGNLAFALGDYPQAKLRHQESLAIKREIGDPWGIAYSLNNLGNVAFALADDAAAQTHFAEALRTAMAIRAVRVVLDVLVGMAALLDREGAAERALRLLAFVTHQPECQQDTKRRAEGLIGQLEAQLGAETFARAQQRVNAMTLAEIVEPLIKETS